MKFTGLLVVLTSVSVVYSSSIKLYTSTDNKDQCGEVSVGWASGHEYHNVPSGCSGKVQSFKVSVSAIDYGVRLWSGAYTNGMCGRQQAGFTTEDWSPGTRRLNPLSLLVQ